MSSSSKPNLDRPIAIEIQPSSPRYPLPPSSSTTTSVVGDEPHRKIAIPVDLSDESAFAVQWAFQNYLRPSYSVTLLHVNPLPSSTVFAAAASTSRTVRMPRAVVIKSRRSLSVCLEGKVSDGDELLGLVRDDVKSKLRVEERENIVAMEEEEGQW